MRLAWTNRPRYLAMLLAFVLASGVVVALGPSQPAWAAHFIGVEPKVDIVYDSDAGNSKARVTVSSIWDFSPSSAQPAALKADSDDSSVAFTCVTVSSGSGNTPTYVFDCSLDSVVAEGLYYFEWSSGNRINNFNTTSSAQFSYQAGFYFDPDEENPEDSGWYGSPRFTSSLQTVVGEGQAFSQNLGAESPNISKETTLSYSFIEDTSSSIELRGAPVSGTKDGGTADAGPTARNWDDTELKGKDLATLSSEGDLVISSEVSKVIANDSYNDLAVKIRVDERDSSNTLVGFVTRDVGITFLTTDNQAPVLSGFDANQEFRVVAGTDTATTFTITATDPDDDTVTFAVGGTFPDWATIGTAARSSAGGVSTTTRLVTLKPPSGTPNSTINVEVTATDNGDVNLTASRSFKIIVVNAPTITEAGDSQVAIVWVNPTLEAGETLTGTKVQYSDDSGGNWTTFETVAETGQSSTVTGLTNGSDYVFRTIPQVESGGATADGAASSESAEATPRGSQSATWTLPTLQSTLLLSQSGIQIGSGLNAASANTALTYSVSVAGDPNCALDGSNNLTFNAVGTCTLRASAAEQGGFLAATVDTELTIVVARAVVNNGNNRNDDDGDDDVAEAAPVATTTPAVRAPARVDPPRPNPNLTTTGPVLRGGVAPAPPRAPSALVGGRVVQTETSVPGGDQLNVRAGSVSLGVQVDGAQGRVVDDADGSRGLEVRKGSATTLRGSGLQPGSTVQVFLPLSGANSKELAQIPVGQDGSFEGSAPFTTRPQDAPLPIGPQTLQVVSLDEDGNQTVMEMTVNIAQPVPTPEFNRVDGVIPTMAPGQSVATEGGLPVPVTVTAVQDQKLAVVEGDGWSMSVNVSAQDGSVEPSEEGALLKLVRNETVEVSGGGFMAGTRSDVWLFSEPTLLGSVEIDSNGEFNGILNVDPGLIPAGEHTLQIQGVGDDGYVRSANLGVLVEDAQAVPAGTQEQSLTLIWWVIALALVLAAALGVGTWWYRRRRSAMRL